VPSARGPHRSHREVPPSLSRVPWMVPLAPWYYEVLRLPTARRVALRFLRLTLPSRAPVFVSPASPTPAWSLGFFVLATPRQILSRWRRPGLSGSWETFCVYALFLDPGRTSPPGRYGGSARPPHGPTARAPTMTQFRGSIAEPGHSLFTLRREHYCPRRKTRFRALAKLSRTGLVTR
jgi:hypothetical protein